MLGVGALAMLDQIWILVSGRMVHSLYLMLLGIVSVGAPVTVGTVFLCQSQPENKRRAIVRTVMGALFGFYLLVLLWALVIVRIDFANYAADRAFYLNNWELMTNFVPLTTIRLYVRCLMYDFIGTAIPVSNLMGNVFLFMPMAVFLPCLFPSMQTFWRFLVFMCAILAAVEALQLVLCCGSCDIDDVILNLSGTLLLFGVLKIPAIQTVLQKLYLLAPLQEKEN